jgi:hypothetical protein
VLSFELLFYFTISQNLMIGPAFDDMNYGYWKAHMRFFLKSIDCWKIVETSWIELVDRDNGLVIENNAQLANDKALHALYQALSPYKFTKI